MSPRYSVWFSYPCFSASLAKIWKAFLNFNGIKEGLHVKDPLKCYLSEHVFLSPSSRELGKSCNRSGGESYLHAQCFPLKYLQWLQKRRMLTIQFHSTFHFPPVLFSSEDHKELLVCIKKRHFHLYLGRFAFLLHNAEPAFKQLWLGYTLPVLSYFSLLIV